jgi:cyanate permease
MIGSSLGAPFAGLVQDATGSYRLAFIVFIAAYAVVIPAVMLSGRFARSLMDKQTAGQ